MTRISTQENILVNTFLALVLALSCSTGAFAAKGGGGKGGGNAGSGDGGGETPVYTADGDLLSNAVDSTNLSFDDIIFRPSAGFTFDLSGFTPVSGPNGTCAPYSNVQTGTLVLTTGDSASPGSAELRFGFQEQLTNGKTVQHYLIMQGTMDGNWPPTGTTLMTFTSWEIAAENKNAQRDDCDGAGDGMSVLFGIGPATP